MNNIFRPLIDKYLIISGITIAFLLISDVMMAQPAMPKEKADSLWTVWNDSKASDTSRLNAIHTYIRSGYLVKPDSAFYFAQMEYDYANDKRLAEWKAKALVTQGVTHVIRGNYEEAIKFYNKGLTISEEIGDLEGVVSAYGNIGNVHYHRSNFTEAIEYYNKCLKIQKEVGDKEVISSLHQNISNIYQIQGNSAEAINNLEEAVKVSKELGDKSGMASCFNTMGTIYAQQGNYFLAIDHLMKALKLNEEIGDKQGLATAYNNLGNVYSNQGDNDQALEYYGKSFKIEEEIGNRKNMSASLRNIGVTYKIKGEFDKAMNQFMKSLKISREIGDKKGEADALFNIGSTFITKRDFDIGLEYTNKSLRIYKTIGDKKGIASVLNNIVIVKIKQGEFRTAYEQGIEALELAQSLGAIVEIRDAANSLYKVNKKLGKNGEALKMHELYIELRDSIQSEENQKEIMRQQFKYNYEKQATADSVANAKGKEVLDARIAQQQAEISAKRNQQYALFGGLFLALVFASFLYNRFRITQKQKKVIENKEKETSLQKEIIEEKHKEITDSIQYAERIQSAIMPPQKLVKEHLPDSFILYKPKDVVAGDFYWMETSINSVTNQKSVLFAACDCTGHGVPGAMVSVVCNNGLNRSVREYGLTDPAKILDQTREIVISEFEKSEDDVKDGMDISFCSLSLSDLRLEWAGANNPLWIVRNEEVLQYKPDKQPIGKYSKNEPFTTHSIQLQKGDSFYIFTDGYQDQFGGGKGKKLKPKALRELLLSIQEKDMEEQHSFLVDAFERWKGDHDQVDDVCLIGVRI